MTQSLLFLLLLALVSCAAGSKPASKPTMSHDHGDEVHHASVDDGGEHGAANAHMHQATFEELVARFEDPSRLSWQKPEAVLAKLGPLAGRTVADLGAGTGFFSVRLAAAGAKVFAVDVDQRFVDYIAARAKKEPHGDRIEARLATLDDPKLEPASVDDVLLVDVYHHIDAREAYFRRLLSAFRPHGRLFVVDFKKGDLPVGPPDMLKLPAEHVVLELTRAGYGEPEVDTTTLPYQYIVRMRAR